MNPPHPIVARIEREHNYGRPWFRRLNATQKYPSRTTRFLYLKNFPRHFLSKYANAFDNIFHRSIDVGSREDLAPFKAEPGTGGGGEESFTEPMEVEFAVGSGEAATTAAAAAGQTEPQEQDQEQENKQQPQQQQQQPLLEEPVLDTSTWTQQMDRLYYKILQILQQYYLTKLVHEHLPQGPVRMANLMENTGLQLRHSFANIAGWDNELLVWLHNLFTSRLAPHEHLISIYHEVMQYLSKRLPSLIDKFYSNPGSPLLHDPNSRSLPSSMATTPANSAATTPVHPASGGPRSRYSSFSQHNSNNNTNSNSNHHHHNHHHHHHHHHHSNALSLEDDPTARFVLDAKSSTPCRRLASNPLILLVPSGPNIPSQPMYPRMEYWKTLLSSMGQLINVNIPYRPEQTAAEVLQVIKASVRDKIKDTRKKKFNELRPLILVGFNQGALVAVHCALENPGQVSTIICLGFPLTAINGFRGDLDDPMLDMNIPILFVVGQMASTSTLDGLERLREAMTRSDTGLVVVGGANDKLIVSYKKRLSDGVTQYHVDKSIADEIYEFVNGIHIQQPDTYF